MTKDIISLVLHILCAVCWAGGSIITDRTLLRIPYVICTIFWSICIGLDIAKFALM